MDITAYMIIGLVVLVSLYGVWFTYVRITLSLKNYFDVNSVDVFNVILFSLVFAFLISRLGYIITNWQFYKQFGLSFLPYVKFKNNTYIFTDFPWRILRFDEGYDKVLLYIFWLASSFLFLPIKWMLRYKSILLKNNKIKVSTFYFYEMFIFLFVLVTISVFGVKILSLLK